ncbi:MAG: ABC transporter ATP-binding protein [Hoeflea sp. D1-CHI-28]
MLLDVSGLETFYGRSQVLFGVDLQVGEGEVVTLMGRNGMGKTTTIRSIMGLTRPARGEVLFGGRSIVGLSPFRIAQCGIGLAPEGREIFPTLTVNENLVATAANPLGAERPWTTTRVFDLFPRLGERRQQAGALLSGGEQQMLAIARALMTNPRLLIMDEATEGLAPLVRDQIWQVIEDLKAERQAILLIDKNLAHLKRVADRHYILEKGRVVWSGSSEELSQDTDSAHRYLGI